MNGFPCVVALLTALLVAGDASAQGGAPLTHTAADLRIMRYVLDAASRDIVRAEILDRHSTVADEPTIGTIVGSDFVYVANSQWEKYDGTGKRITGTVLRPPVLLAVPLPR